MRTGRTLTRLAVGIALSSVGFAGLSGCAPNGGAGTDVNAPISGAASADAGATGATPIADGRDSASAASSSSPAQGTGQPISVNVVSPEPTVAAQTSTQPATVHPFHEARIHSRASGYLTRLQVDLGSPVKAGDLLAEIDVPELHRQLERQQAELQSLDAEIRRAEAGVTIAKAEVAAAESNARQAEAAVAQAQSTLTADEAEHQRIAELVEREAVATRLLDEAVKRRDASVAARQAAEANADAVRSQIQVAEARALAAESDLLAARADLQVGQRRLAEIETAIGFASLRSPLDGVVLERRAEQGDLIRGEQDSLTGPPLFVIGQVDPVRIRVAIPERDAPLADVGDSATVTFPALPDETFVAPIARIAGGLDAKTRTMLVEIDLPNPDGKLLPGMFGQATIELTPAAESLALPSNAVRFDEQGNSYVYVVGDGGEVQVAPVETGSDLGDQIVIRKGLTGDERIVGPLLRRLKPGQRVAAR